MNVFSEIPPIKYTGKQKVPGDNPLSFRYYDKERIVLGKRMADWLKFSVCFWHTFKATGGKNARLIV